MGLPTKPSTDPFTRLAGKDTRRFRNNPSSYKSKDTLRKYIYFLRQDVVETKSTFCPFCGGNVHLTHYTVFITKAFTHYRHN